MNMGSFFAVIALSLAILAGHAVDVTVHAQGPAGYYNKSTEKTWQGGHDTTNSYKDATDQDITKRILASITNDKGLSTDGHNVKVVSQQRHVTLTGPVRSEAEKSTIGAKAAAVIGEDNVDNRLQVVPAGQ